MTPTHWLYGCIALTIMVLCFIGGTKLASFSGKLLRRGHGKLSIIFAAISVSTLFAGVISTIASVFLLAKILFWAWLFIGLPIGIIAGIIVAMNSDGRLPYKVL